MCVVDSEILLRHALWSPVANDGLLLGHRPLLGAVAIKEMVAAFGYGLEILVDVVGAGGRVHPARACVESLIDEELSPRHCAIRVQSLLTRHLHLDAEEKGRVRIDEKERVMRERVGGRDCDSIGAAI